MQRLLGMQSYSPNFAQALAKFARQQSGHFRRTVTLNASAVARQEFYLNQWLVLLPNGAVLTSICHARCAAQAAASLGNHGGRLQCVGSGGRQIFSCLAQQFECASARPTVAFVKQSKQALPMPIDVFH
jgi:hypothetical protein